MTFVYTKEEINRMVESHKKIVEQNTIVKQNNIFYCPLCGSKIEYLKGNPYCPTHNKLKLL